MTQKKNETVKLDAATKKYLIEQLKSINHTKQGEITQEANNEKHDALIKWIKSRAFNLIDLYYSKDAESGHCIEDDIASATVLDYWNGGKEPSKRIEGLKDYLQECSESELSSTNSKIAEKVDKRKASVEKAYKEAEFEIMLGKDAASIKAIIDKFQNKKF